MDKISIIDLINESSPEEPIESKDKCVCHNCGYEQEPRDGIECSSIICPDCGMPLFGVDDPASARVRKYMRNQIRYLMMKDLE